MGKHDSYLSLKDIFYGEHVAICILYNLLYYANTAPTHTHTPRAMLCVQRARPVHVTQRHIRIHAGNLESQIKLAIFPTGILGNT